MGAEVVTIARVAAVAGVSTATVSRVMNGSTRVRSDLAERVRSTAAELGYRPNATAQGLARGRTGTVGVLVPDLANPYFHDVLKGIAAVAGEHGYRMLVADSDEVEREEAGLALDLMRQADGLILCSPRMDRGDLQHLSAQGRPIVCLNRQGPGVPTPSVTVDAHRALLVLGGHLRELGHRRVCYLSGPERSWSNGERLRALVDATAFGLQVEVVACGSTMDEGHASAAVALETRPTAIVCFNDLVAFGALAALRERGVGVPGDVSITGFDDIPFAAYAAPSLTTVRSPKLALGRRSFHMLFGLLRREHEGEWETLVPEVIVRESTGPAKA